MRMGIDLAQMIDSFDLRAQGEGVFVAPATEARPRNVVEGTHLLGQAIVAASRIAPGQRTVSAHATVTRAAAWDADTRFSAELRHKGRMISSAAVEASQNGRLNASALVLLDAGAADLVRHHAPAPDVPAPTDCWLRDDGIEGREVRIVGEADGVGPAERHAWVRFRQAPQELAMRQGLLVVHMGRETVEAALRPHAHVSLGQAHGALSTGVLAFTAALHEDPDLSDWLLYVNTAVYAGHGLAQIEGRVYERGGRLVASGTGQVLLRRMLGDPAAKGGRARAM